MDFGKYLKQLRGNMTLREAADRSGLSHTYISFLEKGERPGTKKPIQASPEVLKKLAMAYNHPYEDLLQRAGYLDEQLMMDYEGKIYSEPVMASFVREPVSKYSYSNVIELSTLLFSKNNIAYEGRILSDNEKRKILNIVEVLLDDEEP
ncbi:XRE family transcriptional regulator [Paenibacillus chitinolyticus]|uniref:Helix-turn-helix domain-containing protein n=1 Tax=Paenibacillus chitinolyticus TaxID=79263 RepID=A0A410WTK9_9BACL|nr:helix-turn-helix transcriptional regulator [Paenibacillus chitinolyticus]MCY9588648.1 helix-turn-helix domain-containing protein [Paenibacillus chitinolyticus]MCY9595848.1 helix-turn-helix domain-containing protein [Paenibacillus chitinolyticus]QAV17597.1 XRE family transcriptional regulator [Paenibacillus chitinolyticus]